MASRFALSGEAGKIKTCNRFGSGGSVAKKAKKV